MRVSVLDAWRSWYEGNAGEVLLPGEEGELCVLDFHHPFLCRLREGIVQVVTKGPRERAGGRRASRVEAAVPIREGIARMTGNELVVLIETQVKGER